MTLLVRILLGLGLALLLSLDANAAFNCNVTFQNGVGDQLGGGYDIYSSDPSNRNILNEWQIDWHDPNEALSFNPPGGQPDSPHLHWDFTLTAPSSNTRVSVTQVAGPDIGSCSMYIEYVIPKPAFVVFSPETKQTFGWLSDGFRNTALFGAGSTPVLVTLCATGILEACPFATVMTALTGGSKAMKSFMDALASDPWDSDFSSPFTDPPWPDLELSCDGFDNVSYYCNDMLQKAAHITQLLNGAYVSSNRASSCALANAGCQSWQIDYVKWYLGQAGDEMWNFAYDLWVLAWYAEQAGLDANTIQQMRDLAQFYDDGASALQGMR